MVLILQLLIMCWEIQLLFLIPSLKLVVWCSQNVGLHQGSCTSRAMLHIYTLQLLVASWVHAFSCVPPIPLRHFYQSAQQKTLQDKSDTIYVCLLWPTQGFCSDLILLSFGFKFFNQTHFCTQSDKVITLANLSVACTVIPRSDSKPRNFLYLYKQHSVITAFFLSAWK